MLGKDECQENEREMRESFAEKAKEILRSEERFRKQGDRQLMGFESEVALDAEHVGVDSVERVRDEIIAEMGSSADVELGVAQIEMRTPPIDILAVDGVHRLSTMYESEFKKLKTIAHKKHCGVLRIGANPFLPIENTPRTSKPKYTQVPNFYNRNRRKHVDTLIGLGRTQIDIGFAEVVSLFQSFQVNIEATCFADAIDRMNRSLMIAPYLLGIGGNARFLNCVDSHLQDMLMAAWEKSHDTRLQDLRVLAWEKSFDIRTPEEIGTGRLLRVGLPERYFDNMEDYLSRAGQFPFILYSPENALQIAIGMTWLDARIKFIGDSCVVELRLLPTQPTTREEMIFALLYMGRLVDAQTRNEALLPIELVRENRLSAMMYGAHRPMWFVSNSGIPEKLPFAIGMKREIQNARYGLRLFGIEDMLDTRFLASMMRQGSPSDRLGKILEKDGECISKERMREALWEAGMHV